jgi:LPS-assembly protein
LPVVKICSASLIWSFLTREPMFIKKKLLPYIYYMLSEFRTALCGLVFLLISAIFIALTLCVTTITYAFTQEQEKSKEYPWHISADRFDYYDGASVYIGEGNVSIERLNKKLKADFVRFDQKSMIAEAKGHVVMRTGEDILTGDMFEIDLNAETGTLYNARVFLHENHFYISGNEIEKTGKNTYVVDNASLTTCDGELPDWRITGKNLKVTVEGLGRISHATLWAKKVPVLYSPFLLFPVKTKRQSGLLIPWISYSERKWEEFIQPFYWAINDSSDATFYTHHIGRRGEKFGAEYRYVPGDNMKGALMADFLHDRKVENNEEESGEWGYSDSYARSNADRYWLRMKHDQQLSMGFSAKLDLDIVSDQDYLREFKNGYTGFDDTNDYFQKTFNRGVDEYDDTGRVNRLLLNKNTARFSLSAEAKWYDDVISRSTGEVNSCVHKLPIVKFKGSRQKLFNSPFYFDVDSEYSYSYAKETEREHKLDVYPRFYMPFKFHDFFSLESSVGLRETTWYSDNRTGASENREFETREIYDTKLDFSSEVYKVYSIKSENIDKMKHVVKLGIIHSYTPEPDQDDIAESEQIVEANLITLSLTNTLTTRSFNRVQTDDNVSLENKSNTDPAYDYREVLRVKVSQDYDIHEANWKLLTGEIKFTPNRYLTIKGDITRSVYENFYETYNIAARLNDEQGHGLFVEHRYEHDLSKSIYIDLSLNITDSLTIFTDYERDMFDDQDIKSGIGFLYKSGCWSLKASYTDESNDREYMFMVDLYGLSKFGKSITGSGFEGTVTAN